jgi:mannose-6-phosphate isomerase
MPLAGLVAEIQQTSDITYRLYDFDRVDAQGNTRELHVDLALEAINYNKVDIVPTIRRKSIKYNCKLSLFYY